MHNKRIGKDGENLAKKFLVEKGYQILAVNWRHQRFEVDIICTYQQDIVFVEVKTRSSDFFGDPEQSVSDSQQKNLINAAEAFLETNNIDKSCRFDIIGILNENQSPKITHVEDAFGPEF